MDADNKLIFEAMHSTRGPALDVAVSQLHKMHNALNDMSNMIHMNRSSEVDQLLSKIRDLADMLIADAPAKEEDAENRSNAQNAAIAISLQKAGKKPS